MNDRKTNKIEVKYQSNLDGFFNKLKVFILSVLKPFIAIALVLFSLYIAGYVILFFIVFFFLLYIYNKIKKNISQ